MSRLPAWLLLALCLAAGALRAEAPADDVRGRPVERAYTFEAAQNKRMTYALFVPTGYDPAKPAPLVVLLHGLYSNPWQVMQYAGVTAEAEKRGYLLVAPYGYNEGGWYGSRGPGKDAGNGLRAPAGSPDNLGELSEQDVRNVLALVRKDYAVDPARIYLMGHSMGGGGTLYLGIKYGTLWAALAPLAPAIYSDPAALKTIRGMPIVVVQGEHDLLVKAENTRRWTDTMKELGMDYEYIEIPGGDHIFSIAANPAMIARVFDFFDAHRRK